MKAPIQDYVFVADPVVYVPSATPRRVVLLFIDTLRPDHLGMYGYARDTSPNLDAMARAGVRFNEARSVSSWTLPSAQSALTGRLPHRWDEGPGLAEGLSAAGFATVATVANAFLGPKLGLARGWDRYQSRAAAKAVDQVAGAIEILARYPDRDLALLLHLIDPHVPYEEPEPFRSTWAEPAPPGFPDKLDRLKLDAWLRGRGEKVPAEQAQNYVRDRYDQEIRYADDALRPLLEAIGPEATLVLFSDHGEEFWEHGGFEHGHTNFDELLRVPLVIRSPGLDPGVSEIRASLVDLAPTVLDLVGAPPVPAIGRALGPALRGDRTALAALAERAQVFGWRLYDFERWSLLVGDRKWTALLGGQRLFDLGRDRGEREDLAEPGAGLEGFSERLGAELGLPVVRAWRLRGVHRAGPPGTDVVVTLKTPGGFSRSWQAYNYLGAHSKFRYAVTLTGDEARLVQPAGYAAPGEVFFEPASALDPTALTISLEMAGQRVDATAEGGADYVGGHVSATAKIDTEEWSVGPAITVALPEAADAGLDRSVVEQVKALGYIE
jgi:arylsulfatase A-like enzyme